MIDDPNNMKQAFRPIKKEKMRLRKNAHRSDTEQLQKFEMLKKETMKAQVQVQMIRYREQQKNYQCEMSINNFYQHPHFKQYANQDSIRSNISPSINMDIKNKFITEPEN